MDGGFFKVVLFWIVINIVSFLIIFVAFPVMYEAGKYAENYTACHLNGDCEKLNKARG